MAEGRELTAQWWVSTFPGVAILRWPSRPTSLAMGFTMRSTLDCGPAKSPAPRTDTRRAGDAWDPYCVLTEITAELSPWHQSPSSQLAPFTV